MGCCSKNRLIKILRFCRLHYHLPRNRSSVTPYPLPRDPCFAHVTRYLFTILILRSCHEVFIYNPRQPTHVNQLASLPARHNASAANEKDSSPNGLSGHTDSPTLLRIEPHSDSTSSHQRKAALLG